MSQAGDDELLALVAMGDRAALAELYRRYGRVVYSLALRITGDVAAAEDVTQDTFVKAWQAAARFQPERGRVAGWLFLIARNTALDALRKAGRAGGLDGAPPLASASDTAEEAAVRVLSAEVRKAMTALNPEQRLALEMAYFQGLTHHQIADRTRTPLGTVKARLRLALEHLRRRLTEPAQGGERSHG